ncbi:MAG: hypothetical protein GY820_26775 [Gammaproteobacteria bacterium]|nr:hypothetical protein [Gammaproteobacteria bacterium]
MDSVSGARLQRYFLIWSRSSLGQRDISELHSRWLDGVGGQVCPNQSREDVEEHLGLAQFLQVGQQASHKVASSVSSSKTTEFLQKKDAK